MTADPDELESTVRRLVAEALTATPGELIGVTETARLCGVNRGTVRRWVKQGKVPGVTVDDIGRTMIPRRWAETKARGDGLTEAIEALDNATTTTKDPR